MSQQVLIFGIGQFADVAYDCLVHDSDWQVAGFTVDLDYYQADHYRNLPVFPFETLEQTCPAKNYKLFIPISYTALNQARERHYRQAKAMGYDCISYVSSKAHLASDATIGENCFILELNNIQPGVVIGDNCIVWSGSHIGHHSRIEAHCFIASHVVVSGSVVVGHHSFIGVNASLRDNIYIGPASVIGAGSLILHDTKEKSVYIGNETKPSQLTSDRLKKI